MNDKAVGAGYDIGASYGLGKSLGLAMSVKLERGLSVCYGVRASETADDPHIHFTCTLSVEFDNLDDEICTLCSDYIVK